MHKAKKHCCDVKKHEQSTLILHHITCYLTDWLGKSLEQHIRLAKKKAERAYSRDILRQRVTDVTWLHYSNCFLALSTNIVHRYVLQSPPEFCLCRIEFLDSNCWHNMEKSSLFGLIGHTKGYITHEATVHKEFIKRCDCYHCFT